MKRVLVLDENAVSLRLLKQHLISFGYKVTGSSVGGRQAVDTARKSRPDIVLIDSNMPGGFDGARAASQITRELDIPVIIIADRAEDDLIAEAKDAGAGGFLLKPVNPGELKAAVEIALGDKRARKEFKVPTGDLIEQTNDLVYIMDGKGNIKYVNNRITEKLGYTYDDIIGKAFKDFINPQSFTNTFEIFRRQLKGEDVGAFEIELVGRDGIVTIIETREMLNWENGRVAEVYGIGRDITVRKRTEEALSLNERRLEGLLQLTQIREKSEQNTVQFALDLGVDLTGSTIGYFHFVNTNQIDLSLFTWSTGVFKNCTAVKDDKYPIEAAGIWIDSFRRKEPVIHNDYQNHPDKKGYPNGHIHVTRHMSVPVFDGDSVVAVAGVGNKQEPYNETDVRQFSVFMNSTWEIVKRKRTEAALRESEEKYRSMVENINDVVVTLDTDGMVRYMSPAAERITGYVPNEYVNKNFALFIHPDDLPEILVSFENSLKGIIEDAEFRVITKDGGHRYVRSSSNAVIRDGSIVGIAGVITDIDLRKKAEAALKESEKKFRSLFETSRDVAYISTVEGRFIDINPAAEQTFGYTHGELLAINAKDLFKDPGDRERFKHVVDRDGFVKDHEVQMKRKDGTIIDCLITSTVRKDPEGAIVGYQGIIRDVTERSRLRRRLIQAEKLSSLGAMISGVAHEINNPLTSIIGNTQLLMKKEIPADFRDKLEVIKRESIRCTKIVAGLLSFAREHRPERRMIDINAVVTESLQLRDYDMAVNNIRVDVNLAGDLPRTSADPFQLQQVFVNLINNSHDALREKGGGTLSIRSFSRGNTVHVEFADDGPGIAPGDLTRIFDPFFTTKEVGKGTGLGLSIAYGIVNEHGGTIEVESSPGKGANFGVVIPLVEIPPADD